MNREETAIISLKLYENLETALKEAQTEACELFSLLSTQTEGEKKRFSKLVFCQNLFCLLSSCLL